MPAPEDRRLEPTVPTRPICYTAGMDEAPAPTERSVAAQAHRSSEARAGWATPHAEVIPLDCEITAYAPAGDDPLF